MPIKRSISTLALDQFEFVNKLGRRLSCIQG